MVKAGQGSPVFLDCLHSPKLRVKAWTPGQVSSNKKVFCFHCSLYVWLKFLIKSTLPQSMDNLVVFCVWSWSVIANSLQKVWLPTCGLQASLCQSLYFFNPWQISEQKLCPVAGHRKDSIHLPWMNALRNIYP